MEPPFWAALDPGSTTIGFAQSAHLLAAAAGWLFVRRSPPEERIAFWAAAALFLAVLGAAGLLWGLPDLPGLAHIDHVLQLALAAGFALLAGATAARERRPVPSTARVSRPYPSPGRARFSWRRRRAGRSAVK